MRRARELFAQVDRVDSEIVSESVNQSASQSVRLRLDRRLEDALAAARAGKSRCQVVSHGDLRVKGSSGDSSVRGREVDVAGLMPSRK